ncbi:Nif3-like dinuclear metal center hexameric protein [Rhodocyclus tenuis]|uniref:Nif3-like dinuclear metal center hexameric protein n=1 Tax=Rhodocyclus gracilis TaxID=2929842 RepID=UPI001298B982|nr:Nif3-like dinuclear metal center hexameric protein [Rhodocyclus gracilis]MRD73247.1 Nif3-like dinuclear metal center hexameric protein [Rhodocyclus gracilis]
MQRDDLTRYLDELLESRRFRDYCPNGLQVEGCAELRHVVTGVTASQALLDAALARGADAVLVHHGWFWRGEDSRVVGLRRRRLATLLKHDINLIGYHLPLDAHPELGNNAQLAHALGWIAEGRFGEQDIGWFGRPESPLTLAELAMRVTERLARAPLVLGDPTRPIRRLAWCSGGAQGHFEEAIALGVDAYLSGEVSEHTVHLARESGVAYLAAGHHATERGGIAALTAHLAARYDHVGGCRFEFVDIDNPV